MKRVLRKTGERLVALVVPKVEAGACVPNHGKCCSPARRVNCYGTCVLTDSCS